jgi:uncharacterized YccA/Bax inhibitor family protein
MSMHSVFFGNKGAHRPHYTTFLLKASAGVSTLLLAFVGSIASFADLHINFLAGVIVAAIGAVGGLILAVRTRDP